MEVQLLNSMTAKVLLSSFPSSEILVNLDKEAWLCKQRKNNLTERTFRVEGSDRLEQIRKELGAE